MRLQVSRGSHTPASGPEIPLSGHRRDPRFDAHQFGTDHSFGNLSVVGGLCTKPVPVGKSKETAKPQVRIGGDRAPSKHNLPDPLGRDADLLGQTILTDAQGLEKFFQKEFTGGNWPKFSHTCLSSMVVHYLHVFGACFRPAKTDAPLIVDPDAVLAGSIALQSLQSIARWHTQIVQAARDIELPELTPGCIGDIDKALDAVAST